MALLKGRFIRLENQRFLKGKKVDGSDKDILKVNAEDKIEFSESPVLPTDPTAADQAARKGYVDAVGAAAQAHADEQVSQEASNRQAADSALDARVATLESSTSDRDYVDQKVFAEKELREAGDSAIDARLDVLESDPVTKTYVDAGDQAARAYTDQKVADLVNSAPAALDTLKELADAIASGETVSQGLLTLIGQTDDKVDAEVVARQAADQVLDDKVDQEIADRQAADAALQTAVNGKAPSVHNHTAASITDFSSAAKSAAVVNSTAGSQTDQAPSVSSMKSFVSTQASSKVNKSGDTMTGALVISNNSTVNPALDVTGVVSIKDIQDGEVFKFDPGLASLTSAYASDPHVAAMMQPGFISTFEMTPDMSELVGNTAISPGAIELLGPAGVPAVATLDQHAVTKKYVDDQVSSEQSAREAADAGLQSQIDALDSASAEGLAAEIAARQAGDAALGARLQPLESDPVTKTYVDGKMADEVSARQSADGALSGRLSVLEADPTTKSYVDSEVAGAKTYTDGKIGDLINGAPAMLDTLKEIADAIGAGSDVATGLANSISQEVSDRQAADLVLDGKISSERSRALVEEARIEGKVDAETSAREQAIIAEATARDAAISVAVMAEQQARELFDASFDQRLNQEVSDRQSAVDSLAVTIGQEITTTATSLMGTIGAVNESLLQEVADRQAGDSALQSEVDALETALAQETSAREAADVALDARLDLIESAPQIEGRKEVKTLGAGDLAYVDMAALALDNTMMLITGGIVHHEGESYTLSTQGGVTRVTFAGDLASGGLNPLSAGDKVYCQYLINAVAGGGDGGGDGGGGGGGEVRTAAINQPVLSSSTSLSYTLTGPAIPDGAVVYLMDQNGQNLKVQPYTSANLIELDPGQLVSVSGLSVMITDAIGFNVFVLSPTVSVEQEIIVSGPPQIDTSDMSDPQIASGKAKVTWTFSGLVVAIEGRAWDEASGQYSEAISVTNLPSPAAGTLVRYASRTVLPQKLLRRLVGTNGGRSEWFELIIEGMGGSVE